MPRTRFRFGEVETSDIATPSLERIADRIEDRGIVGYEGDRRGTREIILGDDYLFFDFEQEVGQDVTEFDENDDIVQVERYFVHTMRFLLLDNGRYAYESTKKVTDSDALDYIFEPFEAEYDNERYETLSLEQMRSFYKSRPRIRKIKVEEIGQKDPNPSWPDEDLADLIYDAGEDTDNSIFSVGRKNNDLKNVEVIQNGFVKLSHLSFIRARDSEGNIQELLDSGRFGITIPSDVGDEEESETVRDSAIRVLRELFGQE